LRLEKRGGGLLRRREPVAGVVADTVFVRVTARQDARVRGQRDNGVRVRELEPCALRGQTIEVRRECTSAVRAHHIGAQRVDGHEQHVAIWIRIQREGGCSQRPPDRGRNGCGAHDEKPRELSRHPWANIPRGERRATCDVLHAKAADSHGSRE
jgi:hypothetical protein